MSDFLATRRTFLSTSGAGLASVVLPPIVAAKPVSPRRNESRLRRRVMTWVPPYAAGTCRERLNESFDGIDMADGLTHLGLQFWNPTKTGGLELVTRFREPLDERTVSTFREWGETHDVRVLLCVYNGTRDGWSWDAARLAFATHRKKFVDTLVGETLRLGLGGVDIDFEGKGVQPESKPAFVRFVRELSERLHAEGKELTLDSFAYKWNAPNQSWWADLLPHVDGLQVMGYAETGAGADGWRSYDFIKSAGGKQAAKLLIGMPSHADRWLETPAATHLEWIARDETVGLALWDAQLKHAAWRERRTWRAIETVKAAARPRPRPPC